MSRVGIVCVGMAKLSWQSGYPGLGPSPGFKTLSSSRKAAGMSETFRRPYPIVAQSKVLSPKGRFMASPCTQLGQGAC